MSRLIPAAYESNWTSAVGALAGVLRALGNGRSESEVSALSGHAFRLTITSTEDGEIGPDGPAHFSAHSALTLYENLGWRFEAIEAAFGAPDFDKRRQLALKQLRKSIDRKRPALAFGLQLPEWGIVRGYEREDLIASTTMSPQYGERIPAAQWPAPGRPLPVRVLIPKKRIKVDLDRSLERLLRFAVDYALNGEWAAVFGVSPAATGLAAYDRWADVLDSSAPISPHGQAYCIQALQSARRNAATFLHDEARRHPGADQIERAASSYAAVVLELSRMATLFPYPNGGDLLSPGSRRAGAVCVRRTRSAEAGAISSLADLLTPR